ncbi:hypothetical protein BC629DRAFT_1438695 [Irpex lacteus]|nr:hypothetical protein BC629DRAFT_1438695 [Irpex lacteus]
MPFTVMRCASLRLWTLYNDEGDMLHQCAGSSAKDTEHEIPTITDSDMDHQPTLRKKIRASSARYPPNRHWRLPFSESFGFNSDDCRRNGFEPRVTMHKTTESLWSHRSTVRAARKKARNTLDSTHEAVRHAWMWDQWNGTGLWKR